MSNLMATSTAATARCGSNPAVAKSPNSRAFRQLRQLRQGNLITYSIVGDATQENYIEGFPNTLPTLPSLPFHSGIKRLRTAGCCQPSADPAVAARATTSAS